MNRLSITVASLIALISIVSGCGGYEAESKRYEVEKAFFQATKTVENYQVKPEMRGREDYLKLVDAYVAVYARFRELFPNLNVRDSLGLAEQEAAFFAGRAMTGAGALLILGDQDDSAAAIFQKIIDSPHFLRQHRFDAMLAQGRLAERQGRWLDAEDLFMELVREYYPPVERGVYPKEDVIILPSVIAQHYRAINDEASAMARAGVAINYYKAMVDTLPKIPLTLMATRLLAEMYTFVGEYQRSANLLLTVVDSTGRLFDPAKIMIADLYLTRLNRQDEALRMYDEIIADGRDSVTVATAYAKLASIAFGREQWQQGRNYADQLKERFPRMVNLLADVQAMKAASFEAENNHERARQEYTRLLAEYPSTTQALKILVYMPEYMERIGQTQLQQEWTKRAEDDLRKIMNDNRNRRIGVEAASFLGTYLIKLKRYEEAINQFDFVRRQYPRSPEAALALVKIGMLYAEQLNNREKALEALREFLKQYPGSSVRSSVEEEIKKLEKRG